MVVICVFLKNILFHRGLYQRNQAPRRIRAHRYPLTKTGYKYLEIGINISKPSKVEIALGDTQGREVTLTYDMWKNIIENEDTIYNFFQQNEERVTPHTIRIGHVTLRFGKINNLPILRIETTNIRLALSKETVSNMINYKFLVKSIYDLLNSEVASVDSKLTSFYALINNVKDRNVAKNMICNDQSFDRSSKIDGELYARFFAK